MSCCHCEEEKDFPLCWPCLLCMAGAVPLRAAPTGTGCSARNLGLELQPAKALSRLNSNTALAVWETSAGVRHRQDKDP